MDRVVHGLCGVVSRDAPVYLDGEVAVARLRGSPVTRVSLMLHGGDRRWVQSHAGTPQRYNFLTPIPKCCQFWPRQGLSWALQLRA